MVSIFLGLTKNENMSYKLRQKIINNIVGYYNKLNSI